MAALHHITQAQAYGFRVHQGTAEDGAELAGRWWWSLARPGWSGAEVSAQDWGSEAEAWDDAVVAHVGELMEP